MSKELIAAENAGRRNKNPAKRMGLDAHYKILSEAGVILKPYGYQLSAEGQIILPTDRASELFIKPLSATRIAVQDSSDNEYWTGPVSHINNFVERFWHARRKNPGSRSIHTKKFDRCVSQVKRTQRAPGGGGYNPYAVCAASLGERKSIKKKHRRSNPLSGFNLVAKNGARRAYFDGEDFVTSKAQARIFPSVAAVREQAGRLVHAHHLKAGWKLVAAAVVSRNPAARGERLYSDFHGEPPQHVKMHRLPAFREGVEVGPLVAVTYDTIRDGKKIRFEHEFKRRASPLLTVSDDGRKIAVIGGDFRFTDRGFVDQPK